MRNSKALLMVGVALFLALAAVLVAAKWMSEQGAGGTRVAVAAGDINQGARLAAANLQLVEWPAASVPEGAVTDLKTLENRVVRANIGKGEPIVETKLAPAGTMGGLSAVVAAGKRAMTVRVNDVVGVAGFALPGNYVDILVNTQEDGAKTANRDSTISKIVLERILVLAIAQESNRDDTKPKVVNAVTLEVSPEQAERLDLARSVGSLSLVLRNQIDPDPVNTGGATKATLFNVKAPAEPPAKAEPAPVPKPRPVIRQAAAPRPPADQVEIIKGLSRTTQQF